MIKNLQEGVAEPRLRNDRTWLAGTQRDSRELVSSPPFPSPAKNEMVWMSLRGTADNLLISHTNMD